VVTNINKISASAMPLLPRLRKFKDGVQVGSDVFLTGYTMVDTGTAASKTYTYSNINYTLNNSDIVNGYYYQIVFRLGNTVAVPIGFPVSATITSFNLATTTLREVHIPDKNLKKNYELENNQQFFRVKLDGLVKLFSDDYQFVYDKIFGQSGVFDTEFHFYIFDTLQYFHGTFMATDLEVFEDDERLEISIKSLDEYTDLVNGMDKEFDVIKITPAMTSVDIAKRPVIQVYMPDENVLTSIVGDTYWEEDTAQSLHAYQGVCINNKFAPDTELISIDLTTNSGTPQNNVIGKYFGYIPILPRAGATGYLYKAGEYSGSYTFRIKIDRVITDVPPNGDSYGYTYGIYNSGGQVYDTTGASVSDGFGRYIEPVDNLDYSAPMFFHEIGRDNDVTGTGVLKMVTIRVATNKTYLFDLENETFLRSTLTGGDIANENLNYLMVIGAQFGMGRISSSLSTVPSAYGTNGASTPLYYQKPRAETGKTFFPIFRDSWGVDFSYWIAYDYTISGAIEAEGSTTYTQNYCYTLAGVINAFLQQIAPEITFVDDSSTTTVSEYSQFFFNAVNPIATSLTNPEYLITPKSNILHGINAKPAQKAPLTFGSLMNMIRDVFKCWWFVEDGKLRIEHIKYFNSGSYSANPTVQVDLTLLRNEYNNKYWAFNTSSYKFDKEALPERFEFEYMDNCTEAFSGSPINVLNKYVQKGKVESVSISDFSADIDYILANVSDISEDGFVLLNKFNGIVPFYPATIKGNQVSLQNGALSFHFIHSFYYMWDLPAKSVNVNEADITASGILKKKEQEVKFPYDTDPNTNQLIKTSIGNGKIIKMSVNLSSRIIEVTLAYDTE